MTSVEELIRWARQHLDEDEQVARAAASLQADPENGWGTQDELAVTPHIAVVHESEARQHIVLHNPAAVLLRVESDRRLLDCLVDLADKALDGNWWNIDTDQPFKLFALRFADRPGYRPEWAPAPD